MSTQQQLGTTPEIAGERDAVHVAIIAATAGEVLRPGDRVTKKSGKFYKMELGGFGVVDPFLRRPVEPGALFWLCLFPNTISGMRHHWYHPDFPDNPGSQDDEVEKKAKARQVIDHAAEVCGLTYERMMEAANDCALDDYYTTDNSESYKNYDFDDKFWSAYETLTGNKRPDYPGAPFTCAC